MARRRCGTAIGDTMLFAQGSNVSEGLGDIAGLAKYRFYSFGSGQPDPGGLAVMATMRLPTGDKNNLRGLGVTRTLRLVHRIRADKDASGRMPTSGTDGGAKASASSRTRPQNSTVTARHQFEYAGGLELEAAPKLTVLVDLLGGQIFGGGKLGFANITTAPASRVRVAGRVVGRPAADVAGARPEGESQRQDAALAERADRAARQRFAHPCHAGGWHRFELLGNRWRVVCLCANCCRSSSCSPRCPSGAPGLRASLKAWSSSPRRRRRRRRRPRRRRPRQ